MAILAIKRHLGGRDYLRGQPPEGRPGYTENISMATARKAIKRKDTSADLDDKKRKSREANRVRLLEIAANADAVFLDRCADLGVDPQQYEHLRNYGIDALHEAVRLNGGLFVSPSPSTAKDQSAVERLTYKLAFAFMRRDESTQPFFDRLESETGVQLGFREWAEWLLKRFVTSGRNPDAVAEIAAADLAAMLGKVGAGKKKEAGKKRGRPSTQAQRDEIKTAFDKGVKDGKWKTVPQFMKASPQWKPNGKKYTIRNIQLIVNPVPQSKPNKRKKMPRPN